MAISSVSGMDGIFALFSNVKAFTTLRVDSKLLKTYNKVPDRLSTSAFGPNPVPASVPVQVLEIRSRPSTPAQQTASVTKAKFPCRFTAIPINRFGLGILLVANTE